MYFNATLYTACDQIHLFISIETIEVSKYYVNQGNVKHY